MDAPRICILSVDWHERCLVIIDYASHRRCARVLNAANTVIEHLSVARCGLRGDLTSIVAAAAECPTLRTCRALVCVCACVCVWGGSLLHSRAWLPINLGHYLFLFTAFYHSLLSDSMNPWLTSSTPFHQLFINVYRHAGCLCQRFG